MEKSKIKTFITDGLSVDEAKVSVLIILLIVSLIFSLVMYYFDRELGSNLASIIGWLITAVAGVNVVSSIMSGITVKSNTKDSDSTIDVSLGLDNILSNEETTIEL